ncbi:hypothetical protein ACGFZB_28050 [Streptomyces cinerochromogenes]|uniref:Uncharacterized protein n=1 Tax=Streptomyces cinerochromogenes TaxID=66422 RepID=A0ABW7BET8_9ACTN
MFALPQGEVGHLVEERDQQRGDRLLQVLEDTVDVRLVGEPPLLRAFLKEQELLGGRFLQAGVGGDDPLREGKGTVGGVRYAGGEAAVRLPVLPAHQAVPVRDELFGKHLGQGAAVEPGVRTGPQATVTQLVGQLD